MVVTEITLLRKQFFIHIAWQIEDKVDDVNKCDLW